MGIKQHILKELAKGPRTAEQLARNTGTGRKTVARVLNELVESHRVSAKKGLYKLEKREVTGIPATLVKLGRSFGFAAALDASGDIFIPGHSLMGAMPGDELLVQLFRHPRVAGSREGEVVKITRPNQRVVGILQTASDGRQVLVPDSGPDHALQLAKATGVRCTDGDKVAGEIVSRGEKHTDIRVVLTHCFGSADSAKENCKAILYAAGVEKSFTEEVKEEAKVVSRQPVEAFAKGRKDLRHLPIFTIDSASTKDIDDAISIKRTEDGYKLGVHIADVSHYVTPDSKLDAEALRRGTSIYYANSVIPMLPKALSNGACSLNPGEDRLAFSCNMRLDLDGRVLDYKFQKSVIRSRLKGVYSEINTLLANEGDDALQAKYAEVAEGLPLLRELYKKLLAQHNLRGNMELDSDEAKLVLDEEGRCVAIEKRERGLSERMIEQFMLLANSCAAHLARRKDIPFVYRVHDKPSGDRVDALRDMLANLGVPFKTTGETPTQKEYAKLLNDTRGTSLARPVHYSVLRSMAKAKYEPLPKGHYGLALDDYAHFTSPIRRYPDLAIHRILSALVAGEKEESLKKRFGSYAAEASAVSTEREIVAQGIERDCDDCYKAEFMRRHIGEEFEGIISSVVSFGVYVELENTVEGLVHVSQLSTHPMELVNGVSLTDTGIGKSFKLGQRLRVRVAGVDVARGNVDLMLV